MKYKIFTKTKGEGEFTQSEFATNDKDAIFEYVNKALENNEQNIYIRVQNDDPNENPNYKSLGIDPSLDEEEDKYLNGMLREEFKALSAKVARMIGSTLLFRGWIVKSVDNKFVTFVKENTVIQLPNRTNPQKPSYYAELLQKVRDVEGITKYQLYLEIFGKETMDNIISEHDRCSCNRKWRK